MIGDDEAGHALAAHVDLHLVVLDEAAVHAGERDRAHRVLVGRRRAETLALDAPVRDHRPARDPARLLAASIHGGAFARDAASRDGDRPRELGQVAEERVVALDDEPIRSVLTLERRARATTSAARREAD